MDFRELVAFTLLFFGIWYAYLIIFMEYSSLWHKLLCLATSLVWLTSNGWEKESKFVENTTREKILVSAQPSHTQIEGHVRGNFMMFSGVVGEKRVYLLREEVQTGLYKDFEVQGETYIREDDSMSDKGKFKQYYTCNDVKIVLDFYGWKPLDLGTEYKCKLVKQEIIVPKGSVIKELNI